MTMSDCHGKDKKWSYIHLAGFIEEGDQLVMGDEEVGGERVPVLLGLQVFRVKIKADQVHVQLPGEGGKVNSVKYWQHKREERRKKRSERKRSYFMLGRAWYP